MSEERVVQEAFELCIYSLQAAYVLEAVRGTFQRRRHASLLQDDTLLFSFLTWTLILYFDPGRIFRFSTASYRILRLFWAGILAFYSIIKTEADNPSQILVLVAAGTAEVFRNGPSAIGMHLTQPLGALKRTLKRNRRRCEICYVDHNSDLFVGICKEKNHRVCIFCFCSYIEAETAKEEGSPFLCPFSSDEELCSCVTSAEVARIYREFRLDYFKGERLFTMDIDSIVQRVDDSLLRNVILTLQNMAGFVHCPNKECKSSVLFEVEDYSEGEQLNEKMGQDDLLRLRQHEAEKNVGNPKSLFYYLSLPFTKKQERFVETKLFNEVSVKQAEADEFDLRTYKCADCHSNFCVLCQQPWHLGDISHSKASCNVFAAMMKEMDTKHKVTDGQKNETKNLLRKELFLGTVQPCPNCGVLIQKNGGCSSVYCTSCNNYFFWAITGALNPNLENI